MSNLEWNQCKREVNSLLGITVINIALAGLFMSLGINLIIDSSTQFFSGSTSDAVTLVLGVVSIIVGGLATVFGLLWVLTAAKMMPGIGSIQKALNSLKTGGDSSALTGVFVRFLAFYRSKQATVRWMVMFGGIGGFLLVVNGITQLASFAVRQGTLVEFTGSVVIVGVGVGYLWMTNLFRSYSSGWKRRLEESRRAELSLDQTLAGTL